MIKTLIIYESRYGTTKKISEYMGLILGPANIINVKEFNEEHKKYDFIILGSPIYIESFEESMIRFVVENRDFLINKKVVLFCTCLNKNNNINYFKEIKSLLGSECIVMAKALGGKLKLNELKDEDYKILDSFSKETGITLKDADIFNLKEIIEFALDVKRYKDSLIPAAPVSKVKFLLEEFLNCHNTCTLSTGCDKRVRGTPIEYIYKEGHIYFFSEGGEKFANILLNENVSISIYDNYENMTKLAGVQISGKASIVEYGEKEYCKIAQMKGFKVEQLLQLPIKMNIIKVKLERAEVLYSKFKNMGYDSKQIYEFNQ
ncbi:Protoporphyrinogen IX oxidase, menaquinone-dependent (flavodoxin domain) [Caloramator quimbayensis]|uniref:Protoporphyrinogen IX oxidase, menaquinone-dependent (Flavodoxin domain) n=1 Tax=Caloramator quimbayensis TaxID=1147123 RepID=A0A1T4X7F1_9CLOT|nr:flavodoxin domain-containing protein [Caloramator quimbayensis]SKA84995.1 Protoporphyrinogen IX oxidase, menaquinone-dependent (flavodoxin domain) [Caloramator quimbayensis]